MTLVEVMLVVFIIGLVAGVAVMTLPERPDPRERALKDLGTAIRDIQDMSILTGDTLAIRAVDGAVELVRWNGVEWQRTERELSQLPQGAFVDLRKPGERKQEDRKGARMLVFDPLGTLEPTNVVLRYGAFEQTLQISSEGEVAYVQRD